MPTACLLALFVAASGLAAKRSYNETQVIHSSDYLYTKVIDGNTILFENLDHAHIVKLFGVHAPELNQACGSYADCGKDAKKHLDKLLHGVVHCTVVKVVAKDKTYLGRCTVEEGTHSHNVNKDMIRNGYANANLVQSEDYEKDMEYARKGRFGLYDRVTRAKNPSFKQFDEL